MTINLVIRADALISLCFSLLHKACTGKCVAQSQRRRLVLLCFCSYFLLAPAAMVSTCSTFCLRDGTHVLLGKNFDWHTGEGFLSINARHVAKTALVQPPELPVQWTAI